MRLLLAALLLWPLALFAVDRTLSDCTVGSAPTALAPLDLDNCTINDGDDITGILTGLDTTYSDVYVRAPSTTKAVTFTGTHSWSSGVNFLLAEDDGAGRLTITHVPDTEDARMWVFANAAGVVVGGPKLSISFVGTHPGLGTGIPCSGARESCGLYDTPGLLHVTLSNSSNPALLDVRANFKDTWANGVYVGGGDGGGDGESTANRWQQVNFAGTFINSAIYVNSGAMDVWLDPDRTAFYDPFNRLAGWDGGVALTDGGVPVGCADLDRAMWGNPVGARIQYPRRVTGGAMAQYGTQEFYIFVPKYIGTAAEPYTIRFSDYGASGTGEMTGLTAGVMTKLVNLSTGIMKNDPSPAYSFTDLARFVRFIELPSTYRSGMYLSSIASGCAVGNDTSNNSPTGSPFIWRGEASRDGVPSQYVTAYFRVEVAGLSEWWGMGNSREYVNAAGSGPDNSPGPSTPDRTFGHTLIATSGTSVPGITAMLDTNIATGPGSWYELRIDPKPLDQGGSISPVDNTVTDTRVHGVVAVGAGATGTVISNVEFTGSARAVITIGTGSAVTVTDLCVPNGSTITGTGTLTYEGSGQSLPYTIPNSTANCSITENPRPGEVTSGGVN